MEIWSKGSFLRFLFLSSRTLEVDLSDNVSRCCRKNIQPDIDGEFSPIYGKYLTGFKAYHIDGVTYVDCRSICSATRRLCSCIGGRWKNLNKSNDLHFEQVAGEQTRIGSWRSLLHLAAPVFVSSGRLDVLALFTDKPAIVHNLAQSTSDSPNQLWPISFT